MKLKIIETKVDISNIYLSTSYPSIGLYLVNDTEIIFNFGTYPMYLCTKNDIINSLEIEPEKAEIVESDKSVSEGFALKMLAIAINKEKFKDLT